MFVFSVLYQIVVYLFLFASIFCDSTIISNPCCKSEKGGGKSIDIATSEALRIGTKKLELLGERLNEVALLLKNNGYDINPGKIYSPATADAKLQEIEHVLHLVPEFRQTHRKFLRSFKKHKLLTDNDDEETDETEVRKEEELEGKEAADDYIRDSGGPPENLSVEDPKDAVRDEVNAIQDVTNQAVSLATGIEDYTGYQAARDKERAKAEADLALSMGFGPISAAYLSGESPDQVQQDAAAAKNVVNQEDK